MLCGLAFLDSMGAVAKFLGPRYDAQHISLARNIFGLLPTFLFLLWESRGMPRLSTLRLRQWRLGLLRGFMVAVAQLALYGAYLRLELASVAVIAYAGPFFVTMLAIPWLGEKVGPWRWGAVLLGFVGVVMVMGPGTEAFSWAAILPAVAAFFYANTLVATRRFDKEASHASINLHAQIGAIVGSAILLFATSEPALPPGPAGALWGDLGLALLLGAFGGTGVFLLTLAYRWTQASLLAPFEYFGFFSALAIGWVCFGEWPIDRIFPGILFILAAGIVMISRERRLGRLKAARKKELASTHRL